MPSKEESPPTDYSPSDSLKDTKMIRNVLVGGAPASLRKLSDVALCQPGLIVIDAKLGRELGSLRAIGIIESGNERSVAVLTHQKRDGSITIISIKVSMGRQRT